MSWQFLEKIISWVFFTTLVCYSDHSTAWGASSLAQQPPMQQHGKPSRTLLCAERQQPSRLCCPRPSADSSDGLTANLWLVGPEGGGRVALLCGATEYSLLCIAVYIYIYIYTSSILFQMWPWSLVLFLPCTSAWVGKRGKKRMGNPKTLEFR